jgi:hypothetical protein
MTVGDLIQTNAFLSNKLRLAEEERDHWLEKFQALAAEFERVQQPAPRPEETQ